jgi:hypothetical protein
MKVSSASCQAQREDDALAQVTGTAKPALYSGKWTLEEEAYVAFLCDEFRVGSLPILQGKSLRCFLADQLGCNAKRISKKYERTGYDGKLQYVDRRKTMEAVKLEQCASKLKELAQQFCQSRQIVQAVHASRKRPVGEPQVSTVSSSSFAPERSRFSPGVAASAAVVEYLPPVKRTRTSLVPPSSRYPFSTGHSGDVLTAAGTGLDRTAAASSLLLRGLLAAKTDSDLIRASLLASLRNNGTFPHTTAIQAATMARLPQGTLPSVAAVLESSQRQVTANERAILFLLNTPVAPLDPTFRAAAYYAAGGRPPLA